MGTNKNYDAHETTGVASKWVVVCTDPDTGAVEVFGPFETKEDAQDYREFADSRGCSNMHYITKMTAMHKVAKQVTIWEAVG